MQGIKFRLLFLTFQIVFLFTVNKATCQKNINMFVLDGSGFLQWEDYVEIGKTISIVLNPAAKSDSLINSYIQLHNPDYLQLKYAINGTTITNHVYKSLTKLLHQLKQADVALLYISLIDGPAIDLKERLAIANQLGVKKIIVFLDRLDLVDSEEMIETCINSAHLALSDSGFGFDDTYLIKGSFVKTKSNISEDNPYLISLVEMLVIISKI